MMSCKLLIFINKVQRLVLKGGCEGALNEVAGWAEDLLSLGEISSKAPNSTENDELPRAVPIF